MRPSARESDELREVSIIRNYTKHAEGSVLIGFGETKIICNASVVSGVPRWLKGTNQGWITAEYGMLPRATHDRVQRESAKAGPSGRTQEIQRLIGRSLRAAVNTALLGEYTIILDCDVIQADGGTRTASITGSCIALYDAIAHLKKRKLITTDPFKFFIASVSVGIYQGLPIMDLDYKEDSNAETDMNVVMTEKGDFVEIQGTAEAAPFNLSDLQGMLDLAKKGVQQLIYKQKQVLNLV